MKTNTTTNSKNKQLKTKTNPKGAGRPEIYKTEKERKEAKALQSKESVYKLRLKKKVKAEIALLIQQQKDKALLIQQQKDNIILLSETEIETEKYKEAIIFLFMKYRFNYFFTGTYSQDFLQNYVANKENKELDKINKEFQTEFKLKKKNRISLEALVRYTNNFVDYLYSVKAIDKALIVYEQDENKEWHTHILFNVSSSIYSVENYFSKCWKLGINVMDKVSTHNDKFEVLEYMVKDINLDKNIKSNLHWGFIGIDSVTEINDSLSDLELIDFNNTTKELNLKLLEVA